MYDYYIILLKFCDPSFSNCFWPYNYHLIERLWTSMLYKAKPDVELIKTLTKDIFEYNKFKRMH